MKATVGIEIGGARFEAGQKIPEGVTVPDWMVEQGMVVESSEIETPAGLEDSTLVTSSAGKTRGGIE